MTSNGTDPADGVKLSGADRLLPRGFTIIAWSQVWGSAVGTWIALRFLLSAVRDGAGIFPILALLLFLTFYTASGTGAILLLRGRRAGLRIVRFSQIPQLMHFQGPSFLYSLVSGIYILCYGTSLGTGINFGILSTFSLRWGQLGLPKGIAINILALVTFLYLGRKDPFGSVEQISDPTRPESQLGGER